VEAEAHLTQAEERIREQRSLNTQVNDANRTIVKLQAEVERLTKENADTKYSSFIF
jgi:type II secretory pathway component PulM